MWVADGERCGDLDPLCEEAALAVLLGHGIPVLQTAREFLEASDEAATALWQGETCHV